MCAVYIFLPQEQQSGQNSVSGRSRGRDTQTRSVLPEEKAEPTALLIPGIVTSPSCKLAFHHFTFTDKNAITEIVLCNYFEPGRICSLRRRAASYQIGSGRRTEVHFTSSFRVNCASVQGVGSKLETRVGV